MMTEAKALLYLTENIHRLRKRHGLTQAELAKQTGLAQSRISDLETYLPNSQPTVKTLARIAQALGVEVADLLSKPRENYTPTLTTKASWS